MKSLHYLPHFRITQHCMPSNRTTGPCIAQGGVPSYTMLSAACLLKMAPAIALHAQHRMHNINITCITPPSSSLRAMQSSTNGTPALEPCRAQRTASVSRSLEPCSAQRSVASSLESPRDSARIIHINITHACIARTHPLVEFSAMSISVSIAPTFNTLSTLHNLH